jgi:hypothetical protein
MSTLPTGVIVEGRSGKLVAEALLRPYAVKIVESSTTSGAIALAERCLLEVPERPIAVLLNAGTEDEREVEEIRGAAKWLLARCALEGWYVAVAIPRLDAWALSDPRIRREFDSLPNGKEIYLDRLARLVELMRRHPFDATELYRTNADFRGLVEFLQRHAPAAAG